MKLIHERDIIRGVRDRWREQYANYDAKHVLFANQRSGRTIGQTAAMLEALDLDTCSKADVDAILPRWADNNCDECGEHKKVLVNFGQEPDYDARWWDVCPSCLAKACDLVPLPVKPERQLNSYPKE
jgi:hypothetical protein